jgi:hypothetical protein
MLAATGGELMEIRLKGFDEFDKKLAGIAGGMHGFLTTTTDRAVKYVHSKVPPYPTPPDGSTYRRTGTLGREIGTEVRSVGSEVVGIIGAATVYAPWVISDQRTEDGRGPQARVHEGRWWTLQETVRGNVQGVVDIYRQAIRKLID